MRFLSAFIVALTFAALLLTAGPATAADAPRKPNIIVIVGDDMGYADIGVHGCKDIPTPHIDSLAKNGVRCTNGYVSGPYCSPTRAGLLTGRYQQRFGHEFNPGSPAVAGENVGLPLSETTLADRLKKAGYATCMVGKWHLGNGEKFRPPQRGFDEFFGFLGGAHPYFSDGAMGNRQDRGNPILRGNQPIAEKEYLTDAFRREAVATIERHKDHPFFLYLTFNAVHTPLQAADKYLERFKNIGAPRRQTYAAMMSAMDDAIGGLLEKLRETKLEENTLIFFISDNGGPPVNGSSNGQLRGHKAQTFEGGIRVPYLVQWKGKLPAGKTYDEPVIQLDLTPTALAAAGVESKEASFDGVNLLPHLLEEKKTAPHERLYWRFGQQKAIRQGNYKFVVGPMGAKGLYDLAADVAESKDLSADRPELLQEMQAAWDSWNQGLEKPRWGQPRANAGGGKKKKKAE